MKVKKHTANLATIKPVENGFLVTLTMYAVAPVSFVSPDQVGVLAILADVEFTTKETA